MPAPDRKRRLTAFLVALAVLVATPLAVVAADAFTDVPDSNVFHDDIAWLADANVTKGCNPPDNTEFCPGDNVTREQMAAFMRRLAQYIDAEDGTPAQADNATTADSATVAGDAETLAGQPSTAYQTAIAGDSCDDDCIAGEAVTEQVSFEITAPTPGVMQVNHYAAALANGQELRGAAWLTINEACGANGAFVFAPANAVAGTWTYADGPNIGGYANASLSATSAVEVPAGTHVVRLCTVVSAAGAGDIASASANAVWSAVGTGVGLSGGGIEYQQFDQATLDMLTEDADS